MGGKSKEFTVGYNYFWGLHVVPCAAPIDGLVGLEFDARPAWSGFVPLGAVKVNALGLYGGKEREGGVGGHIDVIDGKTTATNDYLKQTLGTGTYVSGGGATNPGLVSAFRGVVSLVFRAFYWGNLPRQKPFSARLRNIFSTAPVITSGAGEQPWEPGLAPVCPEYDVEDVSIHIAIDNSGSMVEGTRDYDVRAATKDFISNTLVPAVTSGSQIALRIQTFKEFGSVGFERIPFLASDEAAALAFVDSIPAPGGDTYIEYGLATASQFYNDADSSLLGTQSFQNFVPAATGSTARIMDTNIVPGLRRVMVIVSDGVNTNSIDQAVAYVSAIPGVEVHGLGVDSVGDLVSLDNTGGPIVSNGSAASLSALIGSPWMSYADLNGVHVLRHILIGTNAGGDGDSDKIGTTFATAAATCYAECMGLSLYWDKTRMTRDEFRKLVESHIAARTYFDETTEKWEIKLIRNDYVKGSLPVIDKSRIVEWLDHNLPQQIELPNRITLNYTDRYTATPRAITQSNSAALLSMPAPRENGIFVTYEGFTHPPVAEVVLQREINARTRPIRTGAIRLSHFAESLNEGDPFVLDDDRFGIVQEVVRVEEIEDSEDDDNSVILRFSRDIWDAGVSATTAVGQNDIATTGLQNLTAQNSTIFFFEEMSYYDLVFLRGQTDIDGRLTSDDGFGHWQMTGNAPNFSHSGATIATLASANTWVYGASSELMPTWTLAQDVSAAANDTVFYAPLNLRESEVAVNDIIQINNERMRVDSIAINNASGVAVFIVGRGVLDTVPAAHSAGDAIMHFDGNTGSDYLTYTDGEIIQNRFLPKTASQTLSINSAATKSLTMNSRAIRPYPVGKLQVNNLYAPPSELTGSVTVSWAHRNRLTQTSAAPQDHTDSNITPESGITLTLVARILDAGGNVQYEVTSSIGSPEVTTSTSFDIDANLLPVATAETLYASIGVRATRAGFDNWQTPFVTFPYHPYAEPPVSSVPVDPYWANVAVMYRFNQADASTTLPANDGYVSTVSLEHCYQPGGTSTYLFDGTPSLANQTANVKHYATALDFNPASGGAEFSAIRINSNNPDAYPPQSFFGFADSFGSQTIDAWVKFDSLSESPNGPQVIFATIDQVGSHALEDGDDQGIYWYVRDDGTMGCRLFTGVNGVNVMDWTSEPGVVIAGNWIHVAAVRSGTRDWEFFVDGQLVGGDTQGSAIDDGDPSLGVYLYPLIGAVDRDRRRFLGYFDSFRWTIGVARYLANFTPIEFWEPSLIPSGASSPSPTPPAQSSPVSLTRLHNTLASRTGSSSPMIFDTEFTGMSPAVFSASPPNSLITAPTGATVAVVTARLKSDTSYISSGNYDEVIIMQNGSTEIGRSRVDRAGLSRNGVSVIVPCSAGDTFEMIADAHTAINLSEQNTVFSVRFY